MDGCMAWVNVKFSLILYLAVVAASAAHAGEAQWRVISAEEKSIVPDYENEPAPFMQTAEVTEEKELLETGPTQEELLLIQSRKNAAKLLEEIRKMTNGGQGFDPDISRIQVTGLLGTKGDKAVFIAGKWYRVGSKLEIPAKSFQLVISMIDSLLEIDKNMANRVLEDLEKPLATGASMKLTITRISDRSIQVDSDDGKQYVISFTLAN